MTTQTLFTAFALRQQILHVLEKYQWTDKLVMCIINYITVLNYKTLMVKAEISYIKPVSKEYTKYYSVQRVTNLVTCL